MAGATEWRNRESGRTATGRRRFYRCRERARNAARRAGELFCAARECPRPAAFLDGRAAARLAARFFEACFFTVRFAEECLAAAICRRRAVAQPGLFTWRPRASASASAGTFLVMTEPAAMYAPSPTRTGATIAESLPTNTRRPITVGC